MHPIPLTDQCAAPLSAADHVCIGISPFNSYFTPERIAELARWALSEFRSFHFFVPDAPSAFTLEALGYDPCRAARKAQRQGNYTRNKIARAMDTLGVHDTDALVLDAAALTDNAAYQRLHSEAHQRFAADPAFAEDCLEATGWVLEKRVASPTRAQLLHAVRYFLAELPMFVATVEIVGVASSVFAYHQRVAFLERLYQGELAWRPHAGQGFAVLGAEVPERVG